MKEKYYQEVIAELNKKNVELRLAFDTSDKKLEGIRKEIVRKTDVLDKKIGIYEGQFAECLRREEELKTKIRLLEDEKKKLREDIIALKNKYDVIHPLTSQEKRMWGI